MSKIICEVCGTSFPETSGQCPICGYVPNGEGFSVEDTAEKTEAAGAYTYVKGGRFSKGNVRKRNRGEEIAKVSAPAKKNEEHPEAAPSKESQKSKGEKGLVITIIVLILAIIAVIAYIVVKFLVPSFTAPEQPNLDMKPNDVVEQVDLSCTDITMDTAQIQFTQSGEQQKLHVNVLPANTTDSVSFLSKDAAVAVVDGDGLITAVGRGETTIVVICGTIQKECTVVCDIIPPEALEFRLNRQQITFDTEGSGWLLYSGSIAVEDIVWTTDDAAVATIEDGRVIAVGEGHTQVYGEYFGNKQSCEIICAFKTENVGEEGSGNVGEEGNQTDSGTYRLDNLYSSYDTEVTLSVGEWFPLRLIDENGNQVDAQWSVENGNVCKVNGGDVTALGRGETYVIATYKGQQYRCLVRVY